MSNWNIAASVRARLLAKARTDKQDFNLVLTRYARYTVVAEKLEALVSLGIANSRMKDYFNLWMLSRYTDFDGELLCKAIHATFERRRTPLPDCVRSCRLRWKRYGKPRFFQWYGVRVASGRRVKRSPVGDLGSGPAHGGPSPSRCLGWRFVGAWFHRDLSVLGHWRKCVSVCPNWQSPAG